jgi:hypothetical protein
MAVTLSSLLILRSSERTGFDLLSVSTPVLGEAPDALYARFSRIGGPI